MISPRSSRRRRINLNQHSGLRNHKLMSSPTEIIPLDEEEKGPSSWSLSGWWRWWKTFGVWWLIKTDSWHCLQLQSASHQPPHWHSIGSIHPAHLELKDHAPCPWNWTGKWIISGVISSSGLLILNRHPVQHPSVFFLFQFFFLSWISIRIQKLRFKLWNSFFPPQWIHSP